MSTVTQRSKLVRTERVSTRTAEGGWLPDVEARMEAVDRPIGRLLSGTIGRFRDADEIVVVPDAHYPFHPSTGMVADPAVVGSLLTTLRRETSATLSVAGTSDGRMPFERTAAYLGYPAALERGEVSLLDLSTTPTARVRVSSDSDPNPEDGGQNSEDGGQNLPIVTVPEPLLDAVVVVVPTLRPTRNGRVAGALHTLGRHARTVDSPETGSPPDPRAVYAVTKAVDPPLAIVDATIAFSGEPTVTGTLLAGDPVSVDVVGADVLGRSIGDDEALSLACGANPSIRAESGAIEALKSEITPGELPPADGVHPAVSAAYGLYARVAGDAVPPQLEVDR